jgi:hypothetical protein
MTLMMKDYFRAFRVISWLKNINQYCCVELVFYICFNLLILLIDVKQ